MITLTDIKTAVAAVLQAAGHTVTASEADEGFLKPTFFVDVLPASARIENQFYMAVTATVELRYLPEVETHEECLRVAGLLQAAFLNVPLAVRGRFLNVPEMDFDTDGPALLASFNLEFLQETGAALPDAYKMEQLKMNERVNAGHGTTANTD